MSNQLVKKNPAEGYQNVFPKTFIDAIKDKESGVSLQEILQGFNMYFLSYNGSRALTRCKVPTILRKEGLWITYVLYDHTVVTEWYNSDQIDDNSWSMDSNWRVASNALVGDVSVSTDGYWVINGEKTEARAQGEQGVTPLLRVGANNKLQVSYNAGKAWKDISDYVVPRFKWNQGVGTTAGTIQISMDLGKTWTNLSNEITNNLRISRYIGTNESLPTSGVAEGTIYMKGPYYDEGDTSHANPIYRMWVYAWKGDTLAWQDNGEFTTISADVVQERGTSTTEVMSQDAVTRELTKLDQKIGSVNNSTEGITITEDCFVSAINGSIMDNTTNYPSAVSNIPVLGGLKIRLNIEDVPIASGRGAAFYDSNNGFISGIIYVVDTLTYEIIVPSNAVKLGLTIFHGCKFSVEYISPITKKIQSNSNGVISNQKNIQNLKTNTSELFDKSYSGLTITDKASINAGTGALINPDYTNSPNAVLGIPVIGGSSITIRLESALSASGRGFAFYDSNNNYISGIYLVVGTLVYSATVPDNAVSLGITTFGTDNFIVERTSTLALSFANLEKRLDTERLNPNIDLANAPFVTGKFINGAYKSIASHEDYGYYRLDIAHGTKIKINAGFTHSQLGLAFYNESNKPISGYAYTDEGMNVVAPAECAYILFTKKLSLPISVAVDYRQATDVLTIFDSYELKRDITNPLSKVNEMPTFVRMFRKIGCIGDSLTMGGFDTTTPDSKGANIPDFSYPAQLSKFTGIEVKNFGISGATASGQYAYNWLAIAQGGTIFPYTDFSQNPADAYIIALGTNDISQLSAFTGNVETDIDLQDYNNNANTSVGGYAKIIQIIKEIQPKAEIFCVTISKYRANPAAPKIEANEKIVSIATLLGCWVIDLYTYAEDNHDEFEQYYVNDSHYNAMGCNLRARQYATYIDWIVANNMQHFRNVQFIGTNYSYD